MFVFVFVFVFVSREICQDDELRAGVGAEEALIFILAKISFNIILLNLAVRIIAIFLLIDLFIFSS